MMRYLLLLILLTACVPESPGQRSTNADHLPPGEYVELYQGSTYCDPSEPCVSHGEHCRPMPETHIKVMISQESTVHAAVHPEDQETVTLRRVEQEQGIFLIEWEGEPQDGECYSFSVVTAPNRWWVYEYVLD